MLEKTIFNKLLKQLESLNYGTLTIITPEGQSYQFQGKIEAEPKAIVKVRKINVITNLLAKGDVGFAESYRDGDFETDNLVSLLTIALKNDDVIENYLYGKFFANITAQMLYYLKSNTIKGSKRNIHAHYDLGNEFYALMLDPSMTYSSAIFDHHQQGLQNAQYNKYDRIIKCLEKPSGNLLEVGCGWGGFAERAADVGDFGIKAITISNEQYKFAQNRLGKRADIVLEDYRKQSGKYDHIVSIEMFEAVGEKFWPVCFNKMRSLLNHNGKAIVQTITIGEPYFDRYRKTADMIRSFIFPGGMLPTISRFKQEAASAGLKVSDEFTFGKDYALTLQHWLSSFDNNLDQVKALGFDESFIKIWRFYLSVCIASFNCGRTNVMQAELTHA